MNNYQCARLSTPSQPSRSPPPPHSPPCVCARKLPHPRSIYEELGAGKHSKVYKGRKKKTIQYYAIKSVQKGQRARVQQEVSALQDARNPSTRAPSSSRCRRPQSADMLCWTKPSIFATPSRHARHPFWTVE